MSVISHNDLANAIRFLAIDAVERAKSGHPGMPMGMADVATVLWSKFLRFDPKNPQWDERDRFVLSAGHGSMLLYALLYLTGFEAMTVEQLKNFRQLGSLTPGHPEYGHTPGVETTTGPLGQGISTAVGMALAERLRASRRGTEHINYTYVIAGDGDLMEGITQEAISFAGHLALSNLIVFFDDNGISIDGKTDLSTSDDACQRFKACGWNALKINGHDPAEIEQAILTAHQSSQPTLIACKTIIAYGAPTKAGTSASHGSPLGAEEIAAARKTLGWPHEPFVVPDEILAAWRALGERGTKPSQPFILPENWDLPVRELIENWRAMPPSKATRQLSQEVLDVLTPVLPQLIGGSADLTGSNNTKTKCQSVVSKDTFEGRYIHYGVREHAMGAIMNGLALYGDVIPYGGTFLVFSDYLKPALRLSALMNQRVIYVLTHDSIGLGEDGPTHQPIEHLAALRAIPNLNVFRPADSLEVAYCWQMAIAANRPSVLALTRQNVTPLPGNQENTVKGGYVVVEPAGSRDVTILATGSEVGIALEVAQELKGKGIDAAVVSMPCWRTFDEQPFEYQQKVLGDEGHLRVAIEAASSFGWARYIGRQGLACTIDTFGASGPYKELYEHFGLTANAVVNRILERMKK